MQQLNNNTTLGLSAQLDTRFGDQTTRQQQPEEEAASSRDEKKRRNQVTIADKGNLKGRAFVTLQLVTTILRYTRTRHSTTWTVAINHRGRR